MSDLVRLLRHERLAFATWLKGWNTFDAGEIRRDGVEETVRALDQAIEGIEKLEQSLKDTEFLYHAYFVLASEKGVKPGSRELMEAAGRFDEVLGISASGQVSQAEALKAVWL